MSLWNALLLLVKKKMDARGKQKFRIVIESGSLTRYEIKKSGSLTRYENIARYISKNNECFIWKTTLKISVRLLILRQHNP